MASKDKRGSLLVEPSSEVHFSGPALRSSRAVIKLINPTDNKIIFKIKTTAPSFYGVRPNFGVVKPRETTEVEIARQPFTTEESAKINHKFMVQSLVITGDVESYHKAFEKADPALLGIVKLRCIFDVSTPVVDATTAIGKTVSLSEKNDKEIIVKKTSFINTEAEEKSASKPTDKSSPSVEENRKPFGLLETNAKLLPTEDEKLEQANLKTLVQAAKIEQRKNERTLTENSSDIKIFPANEQNLESAYILKHEEKNFELRTIADWQNDLKTESKSFQSSENEQRNVRTSKDTSDNISLLLDKETSVHHFQYQNNNSKKTLSRLAESKSVSPRLSPVRVPLNTLTPKIESMINKEQQTIKREKSDWHAVEKSDDNLTPLQLLSLNTELLRIRTENSILKRENEKLKTEIDGFHSPVLREYIIPHSELPRLEHSVPLHYVITSMTLAVFCVFLGKYVL